MKRIAVFGIISLLCIFLLSGVAYAGFDLSGEVTYDMDTEASGGFTEAITNLDLSPFDFTFTWNRVWLPSISDSLKLNAGITLGILGLNLERELLEEDMVVATLALDKAPFGVTYERLLDGADSGTLTTTLTVTPFTFEYVRDFDEDISGTVKINFEKSF